MADSKKTFNIIAIIWLIILIALWVTYQWLPGDIFTWMMIAICWSALGGVFGRILFAAKDKRNLLIVCIVWILVLVFLWLNYVLDFIPGADPVQWYWITIAGTIAVGVIAIGILVMKVMKKTQW